MLLYYTFQGVNCTASVDASTPVRYGDKVSIAFDINKAHIFDKETELVISH